VGAGPREEGVVWPIVCCSSVGAPLSRGSERRGLEVFNEALGLLGRMQQEGRIEGFNVVLLDPNSDLNCYVEVQGSAEQVTALRADEEFQRNTINASLVVDDLRHFEGYTNEGVTQQMTLYTEALSQVPQRA
jgi:hypothetical protein